MYEFKFPDVGEGIQEGTIVKWHVKEGDTVKNDQVLAEIETDKAIVEIPSPKAETILKLHGKEGEIVKVGATLVTFGQPGEQPAGSTGENAENQPQKGVGVIGTLEVSDAVMKSPTQIISSPAKSATLNILPRTRMLAEQLNVDLSKIQGTGPGGRITDEDIKQSAAPTKPQTTALKFDGPSEKIPYKGLRKAIGQNMTHSVQTIPHVSIMDNADVTLLWNLRAKEKTEAEKQGIKLTFLPYIMKAIVAALREFPIVNSSLDESSQEIVLKKFYNIGFAVDTDEGLLVPVIKDVDKKEKLQIAKELMDLAEKTRARKLQPQEMENHTFSITNYGSFGGLYATPIINFPDAGVLGIGRIKDTPTVTAEGKIESRKILGLSLAFDHRLFDGALAAKFLNAIITQLENL